MIKTRVEKTAGARALVMLLLTTLFLFSFVYADSSYNPDGNINHDWNEGSNFFGLTGNPELEYYKSESDVYNNVYYGDLNNDSKKEFVIFNDEYIEVLNFSTSKGYRLIDSIQVGNPLYAYSNLFYSDIDHDNNIEIMLIGSNATANYVNLFVLNFNGTDIEPELEKQLDDGYDSSTLSNIIADCGNDGYFCLWAGDGKSGAVNYYEYQSFNYSATGTIHFSNEQRCLSNNIGGLVFDDANNNGREDQAVFTSMLISANEVATLHIFDFSGVTSIEGYGLTSVTDDIGDEIGGAGGCNQHFYYDADLHGHMISSPVFYDLDGDNLKEVIFSYIYDYNSGITSGNFKTKIFDINGADKEFFGGVNVKNNAMAVSNPVIVQSDYSTDGFFCTAGYNDDYEINIDCGTLTPTTNEDSWYFYAEVPYNLSYVNSTRKTGVWNIHAVERGSSPDEIVTPFGIYSLNFCDPFGYNNCEITRVWVNIYGSSNNQPSVYPIDVINEDRNDLVQYTKTQLALIGDGFINKHCDDTVNNPCITNYSINPCVEQTWKINTSLGVTVRLNDIDGDSLSARLLLYADGINEQSSGWIGNVSAGTTISYNDFKVNQTANNAVLRIQARETNDYTKIQTINIPFSVSGTFGAVYGSCITRYGAVIPTEPETEDAEAPGAGSLRNSVSVIAQYTGMDNTTVWLLVTIIVCIIIFVSGASNNSGHIPFISLFVLFIFFSSMALGYLLGIISLWILLVFFIVATGGIAIFIANKVTGGASG